MSEVVLDLAPPPSVNRTRKLDKAGLARTASWHRAADALVTAQWARAGLRGASRPSLLGRPVEVTVSLREDVVNIDPDNGLKLLIDYLVRIEIISDDRKRYMRKIIVEWCADPAAAPEGVRVTVRPLP